MEQARDKFTKEVIDCLDLWSIDNVNTDGYICLGCSLKVVPCSYLKNGNKKRPYFRTLKGTEHEEDCFIEKAEKLNKQKKSGSKSEPQGLPESYPNRLLLGDIKATSSSDVNPKTNKRNSSSRQTSTTNISTNKTHKYSVKTLNAIARKYLQFFRDYTIRKEMDLNISGIDGSNYGDAIIFLPKEEIVALKKNKIWVAGLKAYANIIEQDSYLIVETVRGKWEKTKDENGNTKSKSVELYKVKIDTKGWKKSQIDYVKNLVETSKEEYKQDKTKDFYLFFIGQQNPDDWSEIIVTNASLFTCIERSNSGINPPYLVGIY